MKRIRIHHEGGVQGPFGDEMGPWMLAWQKAEVQLARAIATDDPVRAAVFRAFSAAALARTVDGRKG